MAEQEEEIFALSSIFENDEKLVLSTTDGGEPNGVFYASQKPRELIELVLQKDENKGVFCLCT
jgi:hypothetical protein